MLKIGVIGAGHLGKIHIRCIQSIPNYNLVGFYDSDEATVDAVSKEYKINAFKNIDDLIENVDVVDIVTPTISHYTYAMKALKKFKHVFIEKPIVATVDEAKSLLAISKEADVKIQVGHVERFNPAFLSVKETLNNPMFIEAHRLSMFNPRGTDVPVVLDLMIHDIDIVLSVVKSKVKKVHASGLQIISETPDIANARIEFDNGCVANLTASRISLKNMRKIRFFQPHQYISVDLLDKTSKIVIIEEANQEAIDNPFSMLINTSEDKPPKHIQILNPKVKPTNAIQSELISFYQAIIDNKQPIVDVYDAYYALEIAHKILEKINGKINFYNS
jgi:predicted dehydrogenase